MAARRLAEAVAGTAAAVHPALALTLRGIAGPAPHRGRPVPGVLVQYVRQGERVTSHGAWRFAGHVMTACGRVYADRRHTHRVWAALPARYVPISCRVCIRSGDLPFHPDRRHTP